MSKENIITETKLYELGYHLSPLILTDKLSAKVEEIKKALIDNGAEITKEGEPKLMNLAYEIVKHFAGKNQRYTTSYFGWIKFNATAKAIADINKTIDQTEDVFRFLIIKTTDDEEHSTSKILDEEAQKQADLIEEEVLEEEPTEAVVDIEEKNVVVENEEKVKDEVDLEAIDREVDKLISPEK